MVTQNSRSKKEKACICFYLVQLLWSISVTGVLPFICPKSKQSEDHIGKFSSFLPSKVANCHVVCPQKSNHILAFLKKLPQIGLNYLILAVRKTPGLSSCSANWFVNAEAADKRCLQVLPYQLLQPLSGIVEAVDEPLLPSLLVQGDTCPQSCHGQPELGQKSHADPEEGGCRMC